MTDITRVYINDDNPHYEVGVWNNNGMIRNEWFFDLVSADDRRDYLEFCYILDSKRRIQKVINIAQNQDAEYSAEWALYGEADIEWRHAGENKPADKREFARQIKVDVNDYEYTAVFYRRYPLADAARIEAQ